METLIQDLRFAVRNFRKSKGMVVIAVLTLALGIGANTAIFSVINAVLLQPLPFRDSGQLVRMFETEAAPGEYPITGPDYLAWKRENKTFQDMSFFSWPRGMNLSGQGSAQQVVTVPTEANFFSVLGTQPMLGRGWTQGEDQAGGSRVAVLSFGLWRSMFSGDPNIIGKEIELDAANYKIVGVMGPTFQFPQGTEVWIPQDMSTKGVGPAGSHGPWAIGRLKPGVSVQAAQADLKVISARLEQQFPATNHKVSAIVHDLHESMVGRTKDSLLLMLGAVILVLLIACANVANLLLSRAVARQKEMALRCALGASRQRLVRQLLTESVLLSVLGGAAGLLLAIVGIKLLTTAKALAIPATNPVEVNTTVLLFTLTVAVVAGILFGLVPAIQTSRPDLNEDLKGSGSTTTHSKQKKRTSNILVIAEVSLSLLLLITASLLMKDFIAMRSANIGVRTDHIWTGRVRLPAAKYTTQLQQFQFGQAVLEKVRRIPGVSQASITDVLPLLGGSNGYIKLPGHENELMSGALVERHNVSTEYFGAFNIPVLKGHAFDQDALETEMRVDDRIRELTKDGAQLTPEQARSLVYKTIINKTMADHFWPGQDPIGQLYTDNASSPWYQVIGVVGDVKQWGLAQDTQPESYHVWDGQTSFTLVVQTSVEPTSITNAVRESVTSLDPTLPLFRVRTMQDVINETSAGSRFLTSLLGVFAGLALVLAVVGIYGVLSYSVTQRTHEIGIRMALGATPRRIIGLVLSHGMKLSVIGFVIGGFSAYASRKLIASSLSMIKAEDPTIFLLAPALLGLIAVLACSIPAARASRINPLVALREE